MFGKNDLPMKRLYIYHFYPIENYPPILNFLNFIDSTNKNVRVTCFTTKGDLKEIDSIGDVQIVRLGNSKSSKLLLWSCYLRFNIWSILKSLISRPDHILYYETISALPGIVFSGKSVSCHYHEYVSPKEYAFGQVLNKIFHKLEKKVYSDYNFISQTNNKRLELFKRDNNLGKLSNLEVYPNYPSRKWPVENEKFNVNETLRIVYFGYSVYPNSNYICELVEILKNSNFKTSLDLYCLKKESVPQTILGESGNITVSVYNPIEYSKVASKLSNYHVGVILYKGLNENYIYNAPNKLFEYLSCGLDVWYPTEMLGIDEYASEISPRVKKIDFKNKRQLGHEFIPKDEGTRNIPYFSEDIYNVMLDSILK